MNTIITIGKNNNQDITLDFKKSPHLLIAGATGSGKSVLMNRIIFELMKNDMNRFILIDPKHVEFYNYRNSTSLYSNSIVENVNDAIKVLEKMNDLIQERFKLLQEKNSKDIYSFNAIQEKQLKEIYIVIDELSFLVLQNKKKITQLLSQIGMLGRACGIHLICATQRPDRKILDGQIQANFTTVIGLKVRDDVESRIIFKNSDLVKLNVPGDAILKEGLRYQRFRVLMIHDEEIQELITIQALKKLNEPEEEPEEEEENKKEYSKTFKKICIYLFQFIKSYIISFAKECFS